LNQIIGKSKHKVHTDTQYAGETRGQKVFAETIYKGQRIIYKKSI